MPDGIIKRRLRSLAQKKQDAADRLQRKQEADAQRAAALGVDVALLDLIDAPAARDIVLPLVAYYGRDERFERSRATFYAHCALIYGSLGWRFRSAAVEKAAEIGYGDRGQDVQKIGSEAKATLNTVAAPLEWLVSKRLLETKADEAGAGLVRFTVADRIRTTWEGASISGLKAQVIGDSSGGGGAGRPVSDYKVDCLRMTSEIRAVMPPDLFALMERVICHDDWAWEKCRSRKSRLQMILALHFAIDHAAVVYGYLSKTAFYQRWEVQIDAAAPWWKKKRGSRRWRREPLLT